jgi:hypothetical protein
MVFDAGSFMAVPFFFRRMNLRDKTASERLRMASFSRVVFLKAQPGGVSRAQCGAHLPP